MKTYQFAEQTIYCGAASAWAEMCRQKKGTAGTVLDLRTLEEIAGSPQPELPSDWSYCRHPLTGLTISEQDMDVIRREFYRKPQTAVIGPTAERSSLVVEASIARREKGKWDYARRSQEQCEEVELMQWLTLYLVRHGCEPDSSAQAITKGQPEENVVKQPKSAPATEKNIKSADAPKPPKDSKTAKSKSKTKTKTKPRSKSSAKD